MNQQNSTLDNNSTPESGTPVFGALTRRSRLSLHVAAATNSDSWALGHSVYNGTARTLLEQLPQIKRDHGGNCVMRLYHHGQRVDMSAAPFTFLADNLGSLLW